MPYGKYNRYRKTNWKQRYYRLLKKVKRKRRSSGRRFYRQGYRR